MDKTAQGFVNDTLEIERLAKLSALDYEREREASAAKLGIRVAVLDDLVKAQRQNAAKKAKPEPTYDVAELQRAADDIIKNPNILDLFAGEFCKVVAGEAANGKLLYLVATSRLFDKTMHAAIKGTSAGGKSEIRKRVLEFFPPENVISFTSLSEKALLYFDGDFSHKVLSMGEAVATDEQDFQDYLLRELMSEGRLRYPTVQKAGNELVTITIEKEGPVAFLVTTTKNKLHAENETRMLSLEIDDSEKQTKDVLGKVAQVEGLNHTAVQVDHKRWQDFQRWLERGELRVVVPFAGVMTDLIPPAAVRLRRDVGQVLRAIKAHALLHRDQRARDGTGQIVADIELDYEPVRKLMAGIIAEGSGVDVNKAIIETIDAVTKATAALGVGEGASAQEVAKILKLDKSAAWRRLSAAHHEGFIINLEVRKGMPGKYRATGQTVEPVDILPATAELAECYANGCSVPAPDTPKKPVQPCNRDEIAEAVLGDNGCKEPLQPVAPDATRVPDRLRGCDRLQTPLATDNPLNGNGKSPPVARLHDFLEGTGGGARNDADRDTNGADILVGTGDCAARATQAGTLTDVEAAYRELQTREAAADDLTIPAFLDRRGEACAHCGLAVRDEEQPYTWDNNQKVRLHPHCADAWAKAQHAQRRQRRDHHDGGVVAMTAPRAINQHPYREQPSATGEE
jgi:hypothetical protein